MAIYKISFLLRSPTLLSDYRQAKGRELVEDLASLAEKIDLSVPPVHTSLGSSRHYFYIVTDLELDKAREMITQMLEHLIPEYEMRRMVILFLTEAGAEDREKLRQSEEAKKNKAFWAVLQQNAVSDTPFGTEKTSASTAPAIALSLSDKMERLEELRRLLLSKVRGQRHAVDEVVRGIFQCEAFADDPHRKGPLATFLFAGPSGVGKTLLATLTGQVLNRKTKIIDMSEYSDPFANVKFNGERGQPAEVTGFARENPNGILIFDEIEKAHIDTIYLFLQILDGGRMMDYKVNKEVSFRDNIIIMTTNAGADLYEDATVCDLSGIPRNVILDALRKGSGASRHRQTSFPESITTRMANGHVILFNHLEPYALMQIVQDEIALQCSLFERSTGIRVHYDPAQLAALLLYSGGGVSDARTLKGLARTTVARELQEMLAQLLPFGKERVDRLKEISITLETGENKEVKKLFYHAEKMKVAVLTDKGDFDFQGLDPSVQAEFTVLSEEKEFKRRIRGVTDFILLDPLCGLEQSERTPNDVEDLASLGMRMFEYAQEFMPEIPVYILDTTGKIRSFDSLLARGARGVIRGDEDFAKTMKELAFAALVNNATFSMGRAGRVLGFNCAQYIIDEESAAIGFEKLRLKSAPQAGDGRAIAKKGENAAIHFEDVVGCKDAKKALADYRDMLADPRKVAEQGKKMPKGVLLYGPPGTGKTLLAKAMANESNATFIPATGAGFFAPLVGQTEANIRELFRKARKYAPSIIFIDEIDAIGRNRTGGINTHSEDALTVLLAEMDGFIVDEKRPVFVLAATNYELSGERGKVLDPALVRRFDQKLLIPLPDADDRYLLLSRSLARHGIHFGEHHEKILRNMADRTAGMNNADLENVNANYARLLGDKEPRGADYMDSLDAYRYGEIRDKDPEDLKQTACHEAGHALICRLCGATPSFLTIVPRGDFGGYMEHHTSSKKGTFSYRQLMDRVCISLAGRIAEIEVYGNDAGNNTGASADIQNARHVMKASLNDFAMGDKLYARPTMDEIEKEMQAQYARTRQMITEHRNVLEALTALLVEKKSLDQSELESFFGSMNV